MLKLKHWILMTEAAGGDAGGAGGGAAATTGGTAATGGDGDSQATGTQQTTTQPTGTVLERGAAAATEPPLHERIPEKYRVMKDDGSVDIEASTSKLAAGYGELSKRFGAGDVPPAEVAGYKINVPEPLKEALKDWDQAGDEKLQAFLGKAHKSGLTQSQLDVVMSQYYETISGMQPVLTPEQQAEKAAEALSEVWKEEADFDRNVQAAYKASAAFAKKIGVSQDQLNAELGNNPMFLRLAAALAPEMGEDTPQGTGGGSTDETTFAAQVAELRAQKDALPEKDKRRDAIQEQINRLYSNRYKEPAPA